MINIKRILLLTILIYLIIITFFLIENNNKKNIKIIETKTINIKTNIKEIEKFKEAKAKAKRIKEAKAKAKRINILENSIIKYLKSNKPNFKSSVLLKIKSINIKIYYKNEKYKYTILNKKELNKNLKIQIEEYLYKLIKNLDVLKISEKDFLMNIKINL